MKVNLKPTLSSILAIFILASACTSKQVKPIDVSENLKPDPTATQISQSAASLVTATPETMVTPTPDIRQPPEEWQSWPIIPEVTNRAKAIYLDGKAKGVNKNAFSKIGDCQNVKESFMGIYDTGRFYLQDWQKDWQQTVDQFKEFYNRDSLAFGQGLNVAAALSPFHANQEMCESNESPLQCELRVVNPAYAFIRFERWYPDVTPPELYEKYLRVILDEVIENGTIPILMTKADNVEGSHQINAIIAKLAYEYDIPMYNWWLAAQALPNKGIDPERDDKFHIDPIYAWTEQSAFGLGSLDSVWKGTSK